MSQDIREILNPSCRLLALGEPSHREPAFGTVRNTVFERLVQHGFLAIALETDRVAALKVNDYVRDGTGSLDEVMSQGFTHGFGDLEPNRRLVAWMRDYNTNRHSGEPLTFHGFDAPTETMSAPSPRSYLEHARDYLRLDVDLAALLGCDERWSRTEAVTDAAKSPGASEQAQRVRSIAEDMLTHIDSNAADLIAATSATAWRTARIHLTAGLGLLRYHRESARDVELARRIARLSTVRDGLMASNLLDIHRLGQRTLVFAHNRHLQINPGNMSFDGLTVSWIPTGVIVSSLLGEEYNFVAGSVGRGESLGLAAAEPGTFENKLDTRVSTWGVLPAEPIDGTTRADAVMGYIPLDVETLDGADGNLHVSDTAGLG